MILFSDNGFLMFPNVKYNMTFTSWSDFSVQEFSQNFNVKYVVMRRRLLDVRILSMCVCMYILTLYYIDLLLTLT